MTSLNSPPADAIVDAECCVADDRGVTDVNHPHKDHEHDDQDSHSSHTFVQLKLRNAIVCFTSPCDPADREGTACSSVGKGAMQEQRNMDLIRAVLLADR